MTFFIGKITPKIFHWRNNTKNPTLRRTWDVPSLAPEHTRFRHNSCMISRHPEIQRSITRAQQLTGSETCDIHSNRHNDIKKGWIIKRTLFRWYETLRSEKDLKNLNFEKNYPVNQHQKYNFCFDDFSLHQTLFLRAIYPQATKMCIFRKKIKIY